MKVFLYVLVFLLSVLSWCPVNHGVYTINPSDGERRKENGILKGSLILAMKQQHKYRHGKLWRNECKRFWIVKDGLFLLLTKSKSYQIAKLPIIASKLKENPRNFTFSVFFLFWLLGSEVRYQELRLRNLVRVLMVLLQGFQPSVPSLLFSRLSA